MTAALGLLAWLAAACGPAATPAPSAPALQPPSPIPVPTPEAAPRLASGIGEPEVPAVVLARPSPSLAFTPLFVAVRGRFFEAEDLQVNLAGDGSEQASAQAFRLGQAHFAAARGGLEVAAHRQAWPVLNVYNYLDRNLYGLAMRAALAERLNLSASAPLTEKLRALFGLVVGVPSLDGPGAQLAGYYVRSAGLRPGTDVQIVAVGSGLTLISNLEPGVVDAIVDATPTIEHARARGRAVVLVDNARGQDPGLVPFPMASLYTSPAFAQSHPRATARFVRAVDRAAQWVAASPPDRVAQVIQPDFPDHDFVVLVAGVASLQQAINESGILDFAAARNQLKVQGDLGMSEGEIVRTFTDVYLRTARGDGR